MTTQAIKVEVPQVDGITVKERIIRFFQKRFDRAEAEMLYEAAEKRGLAEGTQSFDAAIELICYESGLNSDELAAEIATMTPLFTTNGSDTKKGYK